MAYWGRVSSPTLYPGFSLRKGAMTSLLPKNIWSVLCNSICEIDLHSHFTLQVRHWKNHWDYCSGQQWGYQLLCWPTHCPTNEMVLNQTPSPDPCTNADGTTNLGGLIWYQVVLNLQVQDQLESQVFYVLNLKDIVILGYSWLVKNNLKIDWARGEITMNGKPSLWHDHLDVLGQTYLLSYLGASLDHSLWHLTVVQKTQKMKEFAWKLLKDNTEFIWRLTLSTLLAQATRTKETPLPP